MNLRLAFLAIFSILVNSLGASADDRSKHETKGPVLSLNAAIEEAMAANPVLEAYRQESKSRNANIEPQAALEDPSLGFELEDYPASSLNPNKSADAGNRIALRQKLPFPGKRSALREAATQEYISSESELESKHLDTVLEIKRRYLELSFVDSSRELLVEQLKLVRSTLDFARSNFSLGKVPQSDVLTLQVEEATLLDKDVQLHRQLETVRTEVNHLLGRSTNDFWSPTPVSLSTAPALSQPEDILVQRALSVSPSLKAFKAQTAGAKAKEHFSQLSLYPDFDLMVGYNIRQSNDFGNGEDGVSAGVGITIPLWRGSKQDKLIEKAASDIRKSESLLSETSNEIVHTLHRVLTEIKAGDERLALATNALLPLTRAAVLSAEKSYEVRRVELSSVLNLIRSRYEAQLNYREALTQREIQIAELERLLGGSLEISGN